VRARLVLLALLALTGAGSASLASGRAACRLDYPPRAACYAEQDLLRLGPVGVATGLEVRLEGEARVYPYLAFLFNGQAWWAAFQLGQGVFSLSVGLTW